MRQIPDLRLISNPTQSATTTPAKIARQIEINDPLTEVEWNKLKQDVLKTARLRKMRRRLAAVLALSVLCASALFVWQRHPSSPYSGVQTNTSSQHGWGCR